MKHRLTIPTNVKPIEDLTNDICAAIRRAVQAGLLPDAALCVTLAVVSDHARVLLGEDSVKELAELLIEYGKKRQIAGVMDSVIKFPGGAP